MGRKQKIITTALWGALVLVMVGVVVGQFWSPHHDELPELFPAAHYVLVDQTGRTFSDANLKGHPYIATFIFTHCAGSCPLMSQKMARLQKELPAGVKLVSFSVDPERDTPPVLEEYGKSYGADDARWHFLTGTTQQMFDVAADMKLAARAAEGANPILHSDKFLLIDKSGSVRGIYDSGDPSSLKRLVNDASQLVSGGWGSTS